MHPIRFSGRVTQAQFLRACRTHFERRRRAAFVVIILFVLAQLLWQLRGDTWTPATYLLVAVLFAVLAPLGIGLFKLVDRVLMTLVLRRKAELTEPIEGSIGQVGLEYVTANGNTLYPWEMLRRVYLIPDFAAVTGQPGLFLILGRDLFHSQEDWDAARQMLRARLEVDAG